MINETTLSKRELQTIFYVGRKLELVACYVPMAQPQARTVKAQRSYGYDMQREDGKVSRLDFESGQKIVAVSAGLAPYEIKIVDGTGEVAAQYRLL